LGKCFVCPISSESNDKVILKSLGFLQPILGYGNGKLLFYLFGVATRPIPNSSDCWENRNRILEPWQPAVGLHPQEKICQRQQVKTDSDFGLTSPCDRIIGFFGRETLPMMGLLMFIADLRIDILCPSLPILMPVYTWTK